MNTLPTTLLKVSNLQELTKESKKLLLIRETSRFRYKSYEKAYSLAIDINDADLFVVLYKCSKAHGLNEIAEESIKKADEIYAEEEDDSHREYSATLL